MSPLLKNFLAVYWTVLGSILLNFGVAKYIEAAQRENVLVEISARYLLMQEAQFNMQYPKKEPNRT